MVNFSCYHNRSGIRLDSKRIKLYGTEAGENIFVHRSFDSEFEKQYLMIFHALSHT